jgi:hypothetical protein
MKILTIITMRLVIKEIVINDKDHQPNLCTGTLDQFLSPSWIPCERHNYSAPCVRTCMYACMCVRERELESPLDVRKEIIHIYIYILLNLTYPKGSRDNICLGGMHQGFLENIPLSTAFKQERIVFTIQFSLIFSSIGNVIAICKSYSMLLIS